MNRVYPPSRAWNVAMPQLQRDSLNFVFATNLPAGNFSFKFMWFNDVWNIYVTLPSGEIRQASPYPNTLSWTGFFDFYIQFVTALDSIGQNDLAKVSMVVYQI